MRFFMVYGPRQPSTGAYAIVTGKFVGRSMQGLPLLIEGTGEHFRDFIHVKDIARGVVLAYQSDLRGKTINLGSGVGYSVNQVANLVSSSQQHVAERPHDLVGTLADTCRARKELHFE